MKFFLFLRTFRSSNLHSIVGTFNKGHPSTRPSVITQSHGDLDMNSPFFRLHVDSHPDRTSLYTQTSRHYTKEGDHFRSVGGGVEKRCSVAKGGPEKKSSRGRPVSREKERETLSIMFDKPRQTRARARQV